MEGVDASFIESSFELALHSALLLHQQPRSSAGAHIMNIDDSLLTLLSDVQARFLLETLMDLGYVVLRAQSVSKNFIVSDRDHYICVLTFAASVQATWVCACEDTLLWRTVQRGRGCGCKAQSRIPWFSH
jgi:hypothetical protein